MKRVWLTLPGIALAVMLVVGCEDVDEQAQPANPGGQGLTKDMLNAPDPDNPGAVPGVEPVDQLKDKDGNIVNTDPEVDPPNGGSRQPDEAKAAGVVIKQGSDPKSKSQSEKVKKGAGEARKKFEALEKKGGDKKKPAAKKPAAKKPAAKKPAAKKPADKKPAAKKPAPKKN